MVKYLEDKIYDQMEKHIPHFILSNTKRKNPWVNYPIKKYIILQKRFKKIYTINPTAYNKNKYFNVKNKLDEMFDNARQSYYENISKKFLKKITVVKNFGIFVIHFCKGK